MNKSWWMARGVLQWQGLVAALCLGIAGAAHSAAPDAEQEIQNVGFMKNAPPELKARFPMCEEFLDVQWLDKKYMVGYATYDAFVRKKLNDPVVRKRVHAIVAIPFGVPRRYDYDAYQFVRQGKLKELFALIKSEQTLLAGLAFSIGEGDTRVDLHSGGALSYGDSHPLLSDHRKTVCIVFPAGDKAWIIEGKTVERAYIEAQIKDLFSDHNEQGIKMSFSVFTRTWILDVNGDGVVDYFMPQSLIYSVKGRNSQTVREYKHPNFVFSFPETNQVCLVDSSKMNFDLTTDGKNYFAAGCNWSELSSLK